MQVVQAKTKKRPKFNSDGNIVGTYEVKRTDADNAEGADENEYYEESKGIEMTANILQAAQLNDNSEVNVGFDVGPQYDDGKDTIILDDSVKMNKGAEADGVHDEDI